MSTPYAPYQFSTQGFQQRNLGPTVTAPAIALMIVASISLFACAAGLIIDAVLISTGFIERKEAAFNQGPVSPTVSITIRIIWTMVILATSSVVLYGGIQMKSLRNYGSAMTAAIVSMIPLFGPCCILGIPFGIWAVVVLLQPDVKTAFR